MNSRPSHCIIFVGLIAVGDVVPVIQVKTGDIFWTVRAGDLRVSIGRCQGVPEKAMAKFMARFYGLSRGQYKLFATGKISDHARMCKKYDQCFRLAEHYNKRNREK